VLVDFDLAGKRVIERLVAIELARLKTSVALAVGRKGETGQLNIDGENFVRLAAIETQPSNRNRVGERSDRYVDVERAVQLWKRICGRVEPVAGAIVT
jgi:hypothetical protein